MNKDYFRYRGGKNISRDLDFMGQVQVVVPEPPLEIK